MKGAMTDAINILTSYFDFLLPYCKNLWSLLSGRDYNHAQLELVHFWTRGIHSTCLLELGESFYRALNSRPR
jgi:hypothetical protein